MTFYMMKKYECNCNILIYWNMKPCEFNKPVTNVGLSSDPISFVVIFVYILLAIKPELMRLIYVTNQIIRICLSGRPHEWCNYRNKIRIIAIKHSMRRILVLNYSIKPSLKSELMPRRTSTIQSKCFSQPLSLYSKPIGLYVYLLLSFNYSRLFELSP